MLFYLTMDDAHRPYKLWRHVVGTPQSEDVCLVTEEDEKYWLRKCLFVGTLTGQAGRGVRYIQR